MVFQHPASQAALAVLVVLQLTMLGALFTQTAPHPPTAVPLFALGPFLGAALSIAIAAMMLGGTTNRGGVVVSVAAATLALVSYGPQKWIDPAIGQIWPAVLLGQCAAIVLFFYAVAWFRSLSKA